MANLSHLPELWRQSGLSQREFCEQQGVKLATFSYWRKKEIDAGAPEPMQRAAPFAQLHVVRQPAGAQVAEPRAIDRAIEITFPDGTQVRIPMPA